MDKIEDKGENMNASTLRIGGMPPAFFWRSARYPALIAAVVEIMIMIANLETVYLWTVNFVLFIGLVSWLRHQGKLTFAGALAIDAVAGLVVGVAVAVFRLLWERHLFLLFNLITEPLTVAASGLLFGALAFAVFSPRSSNTASTKTTEQMRKEVKKRA